MRRIGIVFAFLGLTGTATSTSAQIVLPSAAATRVDARWSTRSLRLDRAAGWLRAFQQLELQIPTLSPAEQQWLKTEVDDEIARTGRYSTRALSAMDSREYQVAVVRPRLQNLIVTLRLLADTTGLSSASELRSWAAVAADFADISLWQSVDRLVRLQVVKPEINGIKDLYLVNHVTWAQDILTSFVIPSLPR